MKLFIAMSERVLKMDEIQKNNQEEILTAIKEFICAVESGEVVLIACGYSPPKSIFCEGGRIIDPTQEFTFQYRKVDAKERSAAA